MRALVGFVSGVGAVARQTWEGRRHRRRLSYAATPAETSRHRRRHARHRRRSAEARAPTAKAAASAARRLKASTALEAAAAATLEATAAAALEPGASWARRLKAARLQSRPEDSLCN